MNRFLGFVRMIRLINCLMLGFAVIVGAAVVNSNLLAVPLQNLFFGFLTGFLLTAASMVIN
ncbi:MAG: geranylgeranylglyceryl phosphate synthase, partial [Candidatus Bathyarchaeia archaeon]